MYSNNHTGNCWLDSYWTVNLTSRPTFHSAIYRILSVKCQVTPPLTGVRSASGARLTDDRWWDRVLFYKDYTTHLRYQMMHVTTKCPTSKCTHNEAIPHLEQSLIYLEATNDAHLNHMAVLHLLRKQVAVKRRTTLKKKDIESFCKNLNKLWLILYNW